MRDVILSAFIALFKSLPSPKICSWPTNSLSDLGRILTARGYFFSVVFFWDSKRSAMIKIKQLYTSDNVISVKLLLNKNPHICRMKGCLIEPIKHVGALSGVYCVLVTIPRLTAASEVRLPSIWRWLKNFHFTTHIAGTV